MGRMPLLLALPLLFSAATHTPSAPARKPAVTPKAVTACLAATRADVAEAIGELVEKGEERTIPGESTCDYASGRGQVTISIHRSPVKLNVASEIASLRAAIPEARMRDVAGMGTRAFFLDIEGAGTQLHIIRGDHDYLLVSVLGFGEAAQVSDAARKIALKALERL